MQNSWTENLPQPSKQLWKTQYPYHSSTMNSELATPVKHSSSQDLLPSWIFRRHSVPSPTNVCFTNSTNMGSKAPSYLAHQLPHTAEYESFDWWYFIRQNNGWLRRPPRNIPQSTPFSVPYQWPSWQSKVHSWSLCWWLPPILWNKLLPRPPPASKRPQAPMDLGHRLEYEFQPQNCYILSIQPSSNSCYSLCNTPLDHVQSNLYWGLLLSNDLKLGLHIVDITKRANSTLSFLCRNLCFCPMPCKCKACLDLVCPALDYGAIFWNPYLRQDIDKIEWVQCLAVRFTTCDYTARTLAA